MLGDTKAYSGFAVDDLELAREFYAGTLGLRTSVDHGLMWLQLAGGRDTLVYPQPGATPASYTILNFEVDDIDEAVDTLVARGVQFERYEDVEQDEKGIARGRPRHRLVQRPCRKRPVRPAGEIVNTLISNQNVVTIARWRRLLPRVTDGRQAGRRERPIAGPTSPGERRNASCCWTRPAGSWRARGHRG